MVTRATGNNVHTLRLIQYFIGAGTERCIEYLAISNALIERTGHGNCLLVNFLLHVMPEISALCRIGRQFALLYGSLDFVAVSIVNGHCLALDDRDISFFQKHEFPCNWQKGGHIRRDEVFANSQADDDGATGPRQYKCVRVVSIHDCEGVGTFEFGNGCAHGVRKVLAVFLVVLNTMRNDFRIGLGFELESLRLKIFSQFFVILDDAVVNKFIERF